MNDEEDGEARASANQIVAELLADREMQETQSYLARGRPLTSIDLDELHRIWAEGYKAYLAEGDETKRQSFEDADAELRLRQAPQPQHLIEQYEAKVQERVALARIQNHDRLAEGLRQDIERLLDTKKN
jgi:hypothetical protein